ncbi:DUF748 domain-containing protein [Marinobacter hydrocarbonoclasticus]|nr:DUF748 domain-containing protein [Marinobacter nauticus]
MNLASWWQRRPVRLGVYGLIALGIYLAAMGWGLPALVERQAPKWVAQNLDAELTLGEVRFHPLEWRLAIQDLQLTGNDGKPLTGFSQLVVDLEPWGSLFNRQWQIGSLTLDEPHLDYRQLGPDDNNWTVALAPLLDAPEPKPQAEPDESQLPKLAVGALVINQGALTYEQDQAHATQLTDLNLNANDFHLSQGNNRLDISVSGPGGGRAQIGLSATFLPLDMTVELDVTNADLTRYWPYMAKDFRFDLDQAKADLQMNAHLSLAPELELTVSQGQATIRSLRITHQKQPLLALQQLDLSPVDFDLAKRNVTLGTLRLRGLDLVANLTDEGVDLATLLSPIAGESAAAPAEESQQDAPWTVALTTVSLNESLVQFTDHTQIEPVAWNLSIDPLEAGPLGTDFSQPITIDLDAHVNDGTELFVDGTWQLEQGAGQFEIAVSDFDLLNTIPYWQPYVDLSLTSGAFSTQGNLDVAMGEPLTLSYSGQLGVHQLITKDTVAERDFVKWGQLDVNHLTFNLAQKQLIIDQLAFNEPYARIIIDEDGSTNFDGLVVSTEQDATLAAAESGDSQTTEAPAQPDAATDGDEQETGFDIQIGRVLFTNGSAFFADNTLTPKFATGIETLTGEIAGLDAQQESRATVDISGQVDRYAPVSLKGTVQPLAEEPFMDLALNFDNIELTSLNPYSGTYAGYFIDQGQLDLALKYALDGNQLQGSNQVVISQLKLGQRSESDKATTLPVALALALLEDSNGVIDLGLEVSGNLDDPEFAIGPLIFKALGNAITKIVTSPFTLLGSLLGGEDPPDSVLFAAGEHAISADSQSQLKRLVEALEQRPNLVLSAHGAVDPTEDSKALAKERVDARLMPEGSGLTEPPELVLAAAYDAAMGMGKAQSEQDALAARLPDLDPEERNRRWRKGLYEQLLTAEPVDELALKNLASARGEAVKAALVDAGLSAERVFLRESRINLDQSGAKVILELDAAG